jgi:hypothetical protein
VNRQMLEFMGLAAKPPENGKSLMDNGARLLRGTTEDGRLTTVFTVRR